MFSCPKHSFPFCFFCSSSDDMDGPVEDIGSRSCVTRFVKTLLSIMEHGVKPHSKHLTEYFAFLYEFAKMGEEEVGLNFYTQFDLLALKMFVFLSFTSWWENLSHLKCCESPAC